VGTIVIVFIFSLHVFQTMPRFSGSPRGICVPCTTALSVLLALHMVAGDRAQVLASMSICHIKWSQVKSSGGAGAAQPSQVKSSQLKPSQAKPRKAKSGQVESNQVKSSGWADAPLPSQVKSSKANSSQVKSGQLKPSRVKPSQAKSSGEADTPLPS